MKYDLGSVVMKSITNINDFQNDIGFDFDEDNNRLIALSASDNLMKGAAGSAIQNMNVMCGFDEMSGLRYTLLTPV